MTIANLNRGCWAVLVLTQMALGGQVWRSDFNTDGNPDGVEVIKEGPSKAQFSGPAGGKLTVTNWDNSESAYVPDKSGRPLGSTRGGNDSFSALYIFRWSTLNTSETQAYEYAGFIGNATPQTRQICGAILRHWKVNNTTDHYVALDIAVGSVGTTNFGYRAGASSYLGSTPTSNTYQLIVAYDGPTHVLTLRLFDGAGTQVAANTADLDTDVPGLQEFGTPAGELGLLSLTHLGWSDYTASGGNRATVWEVDSLAYYNDPLGAFAGLTGGITGACCLPDNSCSDSIEGGCTLAGGTWHGPCSSCATVNCNDPNGELWKLTFDATQQCVTDLYNGNSGKAMIGPVSGGRLQITSWDNTTNAYTPDKAGAPLGATYDAMDGMSALYQFNWSELNQVEPQAFEALGFLGQASPQTRQIAGVILRHWKVAPSDYYVAVDLAIGSLGVSSQFGYLAGPPTYLGEAAPGTDFQLAIGYCGNTNLLKASLYTATGTLLRAAQADVTGLLGSNYQAELNGLALTHLGWSDYTGNGGDRASVWQVDALSFYDNPDGAFNAINGGTPLPSAGACCNSDGTCTDGVTSLTCTGAGGTWQGPCTLCVSTTCPQPPCPDPVFDADSDGDVDMDDFGAFQRCYTGPDQPRTAGCHCYDRDNNNRVDMGDYEAFKLCASGSNVPVNVNCD